MRHKLHFLLACIVALSILPSSRASAQDEKIVIKAADGATKVSLRLTIEKDQTATIAWGDGQTEKAEANKGLNGTVSLTHTYANPLTAESPFIEITADQLLSIQDNYRGNVRGFVSLNATKLKTIQLTSSNSYQYPKLDLSLCPLLETLSINNIEEITLPADCRLRSIRITASEGFGADKVEGSLRTLKSFPAEKCPQLEKIEMGSSGLSLIDLTKCPNIQHLDLAFSKSLREIKGVKSLSQLKTIKLNYCALSYDQIPDKPETITDANYKYEKQANYIIPDDKIKGFSVDLTHLLKAKGIMTEERTTTFEWKEVGNFSGTPIPAEKIKVENGIFTLDESILGDKEAVSVYVVMHNDGFPNIGIGFGNEKYKSENIILSKGAIKTFKLKYGVNGKGGKCIALSATDGRTIYTDANLAEGAGIIFKAIPDKGMRVKEWTLNDKIIPDSTGMILNHKMDANANIFVAFEPMSYELTFGTMEYSPKMQELRSQPYSLEAKLNDQTLTSPASIPEGAIVKFTAKCDAPYAINKWLGGDDIIRQETENALSSTLEVSVVSDTTIRVEFYNRTAISDVVSSDIAVRAYPNPATDYLLIETPEAYSGHIAMLIDASGRIVARSKINAKDTRLDISTLPRGTYFLRIDLFITAIIKK